MVFTEKSLSEEKGKCNGLPGKAEWVAFGLILALYSVFLYLYFVPAYFGTDPNGYHVSGRIFADENCFHLDAGDEFSFIGRMWVLNGKGQYLPKYPPLYPLLCGSAIKIFGPEADMFLNPVFALLAVAGIFFLARTLGLGRWALGAMLLFAFNPVSNYYAIRQVSHAGSAAFIIWGYTFFFAGRNASGIKLRAALFFFAGFAVAYSTGIRYTNVLISLPLIYAASFSWKRESGKFLITCLFSGLALPWLFLAFYHLHYFGSPFRTGYALTLEQTGFSTAYFTENMRFYFLGIINSGLGPVSLFAILGAALFFRKNRTAAAMFLMWILPLLFLYMAYYWAPETRHVGFLRFLVPVFIPAILLAAMFMRDFIAGHRFSKPVSCFVITLILAIQAAWGFLKTLENTEPHWTRTYANRKLYDGIKENVKKGSVIFGAHNLLNMLQYDRSYILYPEEIFNKHSLQRLAGNNDRDGPSGLQKKRAEMLKKKLLDVNNRKYLDILTGLIAGHRREKREVFFIVPKRRIVHLKFMLAGDFTLENFSEITAKKPLFRLVPPKKLRNMKSPEDLSAIIMRIVGQREKALDTEEQIDMLRQEIREKSIEIFGDDTDLRDEVNNLFQLRTRLQNMRRKLKRERKNN